MKVLVLNGSPKGERSNTYRLTGAFLEGLRQVQQTEVEVLRSESCIFCRAGAALPAGARRRESAFCRTIWPV